MTLPKKLNAYITIQFKVHTLIPYFVAIIVNNLVEKSEELLLIISPLES